MGDVKGPESLGMRVARRRLSGDLVGCGLSEHPSCGSRAGGSRKRAKLRPSWIPPQSGSWPCFRLPSRALPAT